MMKFAKKYPEYIQMLEDDLENKKKNEKTNCIDRIKFLASDKNYKYKNLSDNFFWKNIFTDFYITNGSRMKYFYKLCFHNFKKQKP